MLIRILPLSTADSAAASSCVSWFRKVADNGGNSTLCWWPISLWAGPRGIVLESAGARLSGAVAEGAKRMIPGATSVGALEERFGAEAAAVLAARIGLGLAARVGG